MSTQRISPAPSDMSSSQRRVQHRARLSCFKEAVPLAADTMFHFTHSATKGKALWSENTAVWLGKVTFVKWAMGEARIDIPRLVAHSDGAPADVDLLHKAVHVELTAYWASRLASLPSKSTPNWMPLP